MDAPNHPVALTVGHNKDMSLDELCELVNLWKKSPNNSNDFTKVCDRSRFLMVSWACAFDATGGRDRERVKPSSEADILKIMSLLERSDLFPENATVKQSFEKKNSGILLSCAKMLVQKKKG